MMFKDDVVASETIFFWFAANETTGTAGDGASPLFDVRLAGAAAGAAPIASGTPTLLTHADYSPGLHEIAVDTTGYANGEYAVFCTLTISTVNPAGFVGSFRVRTANRIDGLVTAVADLPTNAELATALGTADDAVLTAIGDLPTNAELATALAAADDAVLAVVNPIKTKTDQLVFTKANEIDANIQSINGTTVLGDGGATPWGP